jgi:TonB family protein
MANAQIGGYAPGGLRIMAIPPQEVKAYFVINANGDVVKSGILDSGGNRTLDDSCLESIRLAGNFGPVPDDLKKKMRNGVLTIPFIFGYGR